jgi:hypothetical protein
MKRIIKLKESDLHRIISESVKRALSEGEAWANQPPIDKFHPDWWYYRQEIEPEGVEDFDPGIDSDDDVEFGESKLHKVIRESIKRVLMESEIPTYENPVFINCSSPEDADATVEIGYSSYASSLFYVGGCGTDLGAAFGAVVDYLVSNNIVDHYTGDDELVAEYPDDFIEWEGYSFPSDQVVVKPLVGNHGGRL